MLEDYKVDVLKMDRLTGRKVFGCQPFEEYCKEHRTNLTFLLSDLEKFYVNKFGERNIWDKETKNSFMNSRRVILNEANAFDRLPSSMRNKGIKINAISADKYVADAINRLAEK